MKLSTDIHGAQRINPDDFGDPLPFHLTLLAGNIFHLCSEISQHFEIDIFGF